MYYIVHYDNSIGIGGSLQKDLNVATQALEDVALESANVAKEVSKEVFNPLAKFTKVIHQYFVVSIVFDIIVVLIHDPLHFTSRSVPEDMSFFKIIAPFRR